MNDAQDAINAAARAVADAAVAVNRAWEAYEATERLPAPFANRAADNYAQLGAKFDKALTAYMRLTADTSSATREG